ncbi:MAG: copper resistance protein CopC/CopD [Ilumatobacteraceae bacterium]|jgi:copper transport protein|nr:copper resistance protein CopC/CopD [Ilumatobacteraceae bacterium]
MTKSLRLRISVRRMTSMIFLAIVGVGFVGGGVALAHNSATGSSPSNGEVLTTSPPQWTMTFAKAVPLTSASGQLVGDDGVRRTLPNPRHGTTDNVIIFDLPADISGRVTARWRLVGTDGHVISGRVSFSVQATTASSSTSLAVPVNPAETSSSVPLPGTTVGSANISPATSTPVVADQPEEENRPVPELVRTLVRFSTFAVLTLFGGIFFAEWYIAQGTLFTNRGRRLANGTALGLFIFPVASLMILIDDLRGSFGTLFDGLSAAASLTIGPMIMARIAFGALLARLTRSLLVRGGARQQDLLYILLVLIPYCVTLSYGGHSRSQRLPQIGVPADVIHVLAISAWLGGLAIVLVVVIPAVKPDEALPAFLRFGYAAERAVPIIIVTGLVQSFRLHQSVGSLLTSNHGLLLLTKIGVVLAMLSLGNRNRKVLINRRNLTGPRAEISRTILMQRSVYEFLLGAIAVGITSVLVSVTPT